MLLWVPEVLFRVQLRESKFFASLRRPNATGTRGKTATGNPIRPSSSTQGTTMPTLPGVPRIPTKSPGNVSLQISRTLRMKAHKIHSDIFLHFGIEPKSDRCFCYFTAAMFVSLRRLRRTQTWRLHTKLCKFGWHASANNTRMENSRDLILGEIVYINYLLYPRYLT